MTALMNLRRLVSECREGSHDITAMGAGIHPGTVVQEIQQGHIFTSVQSCLTLFDPMDFITPGLPVHHQLPEFTQTHVR